MFQGENVTPPMLALLEKVCEVGVLYRRCCSYLSNAWDRHRSGRLSLTEQVHLPSLIIIAILILIAILSFTS